MDLVEKEDLDLVCTVCTVCTYVRTYVFMCVNIIYIYIPVYTIILYSETSVIRHLCNPTFSLIRPSYEVHPPY